LLKRTPPCKVGAALDALLGLVHSHNSALRQCTIYVKTVLNPSGLHPKPFSLSSLLSSLELSATQVYATYIRALLRTASHFCNVVVLQLRTSKSVFEIRSLRVWQNGPVSLLRAGIPLDLFTLHPSHGRLFEGYPMPVLGTVCPVFVNVWKNVLTFSEQSVNVDV